jgi:hypothetical protein
MLLNHEGHEVFFWAKQNFVVFVPSWLIVVADRQRRQ